MCYNEDKPKKIDNSPGKQKSMKLYRAYNLCIVGMQWNFSIINGREQRVNSTQIDANILV